MAAATWDLYIAVHGRPAGLLEDDAEANLSSILAADRALDGVFRRLEEMGARIPRNYVGWIFGKEKRVALLWTFCAQVALHLRNEGKSGRVADQIVAEARGCTSEAIRVAVKKLTAEQRAAVSSSVDVNTVYRVETIKYYQAELFRWLPDTGVRLKKVKNV
jgi:hypothetical protein